jgi:PAS domain S-box-containing protein
MQWLPTSRIRGVRSPIDIGFLIGAVVLIVVGWVSHRSSGKLREDASWVEHSQEVLRSIDRLRYALDQPTDSGRIQAAAQLAQLRELTVDSPIQQATIDSVRERLVRGDPTAADAIASAERYEQKLLIDRRATAESTATRTRVVILFSTCLALVLMAAALALLHRDLSERKTAEVALAESEVKYRLLMEQAADAILIVDASATCVEGNTRAAEMLGRPQSEIPGLPLKAFVRGPSHNAGPVLPMLRYGHVTTGEFWVSRPDGTRLPVEIRATMLEDGRVQVIARDISERKEVERVKDEFVSVVSHELRTPLTSIRGALGLLAAGRLDDAPEKRQRMLQLAASNTDRLIRLINDILDIERMNSGGITFERSELSTIELVTQATEAIRPLADRAGITIEVDADDLHVFADGDRLTQTLTNLLDNAIKFSPPDSRIDVTVRRDGRNALFAIRDRGRGIPPEMREKIFGRFQQVDNSDAREKGGSGLGLAICRSIVDQHGGRIWVESAPDAGSTFKFTIPLVVEERPLPGANGTTQILVCDDDADLVEVLRATLSERGYYVIGARRGRDAIEQFDRLGAQLAIIDIVLPDISGLRVLRHIHSTAPNTRILVYTATYIEGPEKDFIRGIGAVIVTKGRTSPEQLADEVENLASARVASTGDNATESV